MRQGRGQKTEVGRKSEVGGQNFGPATILALATLCLAAGCARPSDDAAAAARAALEPDPVVRLRIEGADSRGASLAASGMRVVVVWAATTADQTNIYSSVSDDAGVTFGAPVRVNDVDGDARVNGEQPPRVAVGRDIVVAWQSRRTGVSQIRAARSIDDGRSFQHAATIHGETLTGARGWSSLVLDAEGAAHIAWLDGRNAVKKTPMSPGAAGGHAHSEPTRQDIFQVTLRPDGTREEASVATNVCFCCKTSIATGPRGSLYVAWRHIYPTNLRDMAVAASVDGGRTFTAPVRVSEDGWQVDGCPEDGPSIAADAAGILHIVWPTIVDKQATRKGIFHSYSRDGGRTFAPRARVDTGDDVKSAAHPQIATAGERLAIVWDESTEAGPRVRVRLIESPPAPNESAPRFSEPLTVSDRGPVTYPSVTSTAGALIAAWTVNSANGSEVQVRRMQQRR